MQDVKYERNTNRFNCLGLDLNRPVDSVKDGKFPYLKNCRTYIAGTVEPRMGLGDVGEVVAGQSPVHSCRELNDPNTATSALIVGTGTHLAYESAPFTDIDSGYSGDPLALQPWKPGESPTPYMYVADRLRMRKITVAGILDTIGYAAPTAAPGVALANNPQSKVIDDFAATAGWTQSPAVGGSPSLISRTPGGAAGTTTTIAHIVYDSGTTGWASINLTSMIGVTYGERLTFDPAGTPETVPVQSVFPVSAATTIGSIIYDSGTTGMASIVLTTPVNQVNIDALIRNTTVGPENARIVAVTIGPDGTTSLRVSTTNTWAATNAVQILATLRVYVGTAYAAAAVVMNDALKVNITATGLTTVTKTIALDLSSYATGVASLQDDYMTIALRVDRPDLISEMKVLLDVDSATNDFTRNFYYRAIRPSDLTPNVRNQQPLITTNAQIIQRTLLSNTTTANKQAGIFEEDPGIAPSGEVTTEPTDPQVQSSQLESGDVQWVPVRFRISDLIRVGTDDTRTLANVAAIRINAVVTGAVVIDMDSWWVGGGYGPDTGGATSIPYSYRYRVRNPATNVASNFSPATRLLVDPQRGQVAITMTQYAAPTPSIVAANLVLDIERFGGEIADWHYIGTIANAASPGYIDELADDIVGGNPIQGNDNYQPWPIKGVPVSGTTGTVAGTTINDSGTTFNLSWAPGNRILVNNVPYTIYRVISTSRLELVENAGTQSAVTWRIDEPTILAQPLPCLWVWDNVFFACGDLVNPGRLYYSNFTSETTRIDNYLDLTSPSEPLMNGLQYNIRSYVFSSENMIQILKTGNIEAPFRSEHVPNGKGLFARWMITLEPAPFITFGSKDGLYMTNGGAAVSITDEDLFPLFPNEGNLGISVNGVPPPNVASDQANNLRLAYYDEFIYFDYAFDDIELGVGVSTLVGMMTGNQVAWFWDIYEPNAVMHYGAEGAGAHALFIGGSTGHLYQYAGNSDNGASFSMEITTPSRDQGDPRLNKFYGDIMLDADMNGATVSARPFFNNNTFAATAISTSNGSRGLITLPFDSAWVTARNISLSLVASINSAERPIYYIWEPRWTFESAGISAISWEISPTSFGMDNFKHFGLCKITHVSFVPLYLIFTVDGVVQPTITIPSSGGIYAQNIFRVPVMKGKIYKLRIASANNTTDIRLDPRDTFMEIKNWGDDGPYQRVRPFADYSMIEG